MPDTALNLSAGCYAARLGKQSATRRFTPPTRSVANVMFFSSQRRFAPEGTTIGISEQF
jgi:hypothetical protein